MHVPTSTYRIQFHKDFTFKDLIQIIDYLYDLGISTIYASPILKSTSGSAHGYDATDPHSLDPEIGSLEELKEIAVKLKQRNMNWLQDIVPNHMAFDPSNYRLMDVLERGPQSPYYNYFDIIWNHPSPVLRGKLMVPFLGKELKTCLDNRQIQLSFSERGFEVDYFDTHYPLSTSAYPYLFSFADSQRTKVIQDTWMELIKDSAGQNDYNGWNMHKMKWVGTVRSASEQSSLADLLSTINEDSEMLKRLLEQQYYVLAYWKQTEKEINYRRFFTINQLICLRMEDEMVFDEYHQFLYRLYKDNLIQGLRIDHIDGLKDPSAYIKRLRKLFGDSCYIIAEKILETNEAMPASWSLQGTSGYEFLAYTNQLYTDRKGAKRLLEFYKELIPDSLPYNELVMENKILILENYMEGEWNNLVHYLFELQLNGNFELSKLKKALGLIMVSLPVYRIYPDVIPLTGEDLTIMNETFKRARKVDPDCQAELDHFYTVLVSPSDTLPYQPILNFLKRLMQFTGPLTAKGVEDTTFYVYNPLISHDEVGDSPATLGISVGQFHAAMAARQVSIPLSLNATATHDTKRGEDVRIRLNLLSEQPMAWKELVKQWVEMNKPFRVEVQGKTAPSINDEYFIYQSIAGGFPEDLIVTDAWIKRLQEYIVKVVREAKVKSNWESPDESYENACTQFIGLILTNESGFLSSVLPFVQKICFYANTNALGQTLIKITAPGIPDIYQGGALWDLSYVDPDNRRPVDYALRQRNLGQILEKEKEGQDALISFLALHRNTGMEKLFVTWKALNFRKKNSIIFSEGIYFPLQLTIKEPVACAYARGNKDQWVITAIPLGVMSRGETDKFVKKHTSDAAIVLPEHLPRFWTNVFTGKRITASNNLKLEEAWKDFPVALLVSR